MCHEKRKTLIMVLVYPFLQAIGRSLYVTHARKRLPMKVILHHRIYVTPLERFKNGELVREVERTIAQLVPFGNVWLVHAHSLRKASRRSARPVHRT